MLPRLSCETARSLVGTDVDVAKGHTQLYRRFLGNVGGCCNMPTRMIYTCVLLTTYTTFQLSMDIVTCDEVYTLFCNISDEV